MTRLVRATGPQMALSWSPDRRRHRRHVTRSPAKAFTPPAGNRPGAFPTRRRRQPRSPVSAAPPGSKAQRIFRPGALPTRRRRQPRSPAKAFTPPAGNRPCFSRGSPYSAGRCSSGAPVRRTPQFPSFAPDAPGAAVGTRRALCRWRPPGDGWR